MLPCGIKGVVRRFAKAALDTETYVELSGKAAFAGVNVTCWVQPAATADSLSSRPNE